MDLRDGKEATPQGVSRADRWSAARRYFEPGGPEILRDVVLRAIQTRAVGLVVVAVVLGALAGLVVTGTTFLAQHLHEVLFQLPKGARLSAQIGLANPWLAAVPAVGGTTIGLSIFILRRYRKRIMVDPIEANALHGGKMSMVDSIILAIQTLLSNGFGASVGLEAGYTQLSSALASKAGQILQLRRNDLRILVGCGAAGAVAAAFDAPLTGAFYAFELVIGVYTVAAVAPVMAAALVATLTANWLGAVQFSIAVEDVGGLTAAEYLPFLVLGALGGGVAIFVMKLVASVEAGYAALAIRPQLRPFIGGCVIGCFALVTPQVLSSGNGALHFGLTRDPALAMVAVVFVLKILAAAISLGSGFRGGLFFASLFIGGMLGALFSALTVAIAPGLASDTLIASVVGMTSVAVGVVGGPLTMTFLALEVSSDLALAGAVLAAAIVSSLLVRETFGYSFSTWRLHLRGETIRSANDVGWMRSLTVQSMMRSDVKTIEIDTRLDAFRAKFPLGSTQRVVVVDDDARYVGIVLVADAYGTEADPATAGLQDLLLSKDDWLLPAMNAKTAAKVFEETRTEELAVLDSDRKVLGLLTEGHLLRRYADELERVRRDLSGER